MFFLHSLIWGLLTWQNSTFYGYQIRHSLALKVYIHKVFIYISPIYRERLHSISTCSEDTVWGWLQKLTVQTIQSKSLQCRKDLYHQFGAKQSLQKQPISVVKKRSDNLIWWYDDHNWYDDMILYLTHGNVKINILESPSFKNIAHDGPFKLFRSAEVKCSCFAAGESLISWWIF